MEISTDPPLRAAGRSPHPEPHPSKPSRGTRLLVFVLQASVMAAALFLFFLFAGIAVLVLAHLLIAGRALRHRRLLLDPPKDDARQGLSRDELKRMPSCRFSTKGRAASRWSDCAVCLEGLRDGERCRVLPACGHGFHKSCVDRWLVRSPACPVCRAGVGVGVGRRR